MQLHYWYITRAPSHKVCNGNLRFIQLPKQSNVRNRLPSGPNKTVSSTIRKVCDVFQSTYCTVEHLYNLARSLAPTKNKENTKAQHDCPFGRGIRGINLWSADCPHKWIITRKTFRWLDIVLISHCSQLHKWYWILRPNICHCSVHSDYFSLHLIIYVLKSKANIQSKCSIIIFDTQVLQVVETLPHGRQKPANPT